MTQKSGIPLPPTCFGDIIELAIPDGPVSSDEDKDVYTSKLGGRPIWLNSPSVALLDSLKCRRCQTPLYLLLQMDAPREEASQHDRICYVFACNTRLCSQDPRGWRVIFMKKEKKAAQGASASGDQGKVVPSFWDFVMKEDEGDQGQEVGQISQKAASISLNPPKPSVNPTPSSTTVKPGRFPGIYLHIEEELVLEKKKGKHHAIDSSSTIIKSGGSNASGNNDTEDWGDEHYEKFRAPGTDRSFSRFQKRVAHYPRQCVRFAVTRGQEPLLFHDCEDFKGDLGGMACCSGCGKNRFSFELQLMPAILAFLPTESDSHLSHIPPHERSKNPIISDGMEWGSVFVYSCDFIDGCLADTTLGHYEGCVMIQLERQ